MDITKIAGFDSLDDAVAAIAKAEGLPRHAAMSEAARRFPDLHKRYNDDGDQIVAKAAERMRYPTVPPAVREFQANVMEVARRDGCDSVSALRRARAENPQLFEQYQATGFPTSQ